MLCEIIFAIYLIIVFINCWIAFCCINTINWLCLTPIELRNKGFNWFEVISFFIFELILNPIVWLIEGVVLIFVR